MYAPDNFLINFGMILFIRLSKILSFFVVERNSSIDHEKKHVKYVNVYMKQCSWRQRHITYKQHRDNLQTIEACIYMVATIIVITCHYYIHVSRIHVYVKR